MPQWAALLIAGTVAWIAWAALARGLTRTRIRGDDTLAALALGFIRLYGRVVHNLRVSGLEHVPRARRGEDGRPEAGPLLVVANHTAGVDPLLIQSALDFEVKWVMAEDMRVAYFEAMWQWIGLIFLDRRTSESMPLRRALRHLRSGGVLGIFPEGAIERPPRRLLPFREGVGMLVARGGAPVLPVVVDGTPQVQTAWGSLIKPSRSQVRFLPLMPAEKFKGLDAAAATAALEEVFTSATGWASD